MDSEVGGGVEDITTDWRSKSSRVMTYDMVGMVISNDVWACGEE